MRTTADSYPIPLTADVDERDYTEKRPVPSEVLVSFLAPGSYAADQYRALRHTVERVHADGKQVLAVTSPGAGDGKSVTSLNLAGALAQRADARVIVLDADLRKPNVAAYLGWPAACEPGLVDALSENGEIDASRFVRAVAGFNLSVFPAGAPQQSPYELLSSPRFESVIAELRRSYDYVIVDAPPFVPLPDCRLIERCVDGFVIVVAAHKTPRPLFFELLDLIDPAKISAVVFNGDDRPASSYYGYSGYYGTSRRS